MTHKKLDFIQGLRGIAVMMVVLHHGYGFIDGMEGNDYNSIYNRFFMPGMGGVDLFFIISGFIMVITTWKSDGSIKNLKEFYIKRVSRIVPVYFILTLIYIFICLGGMSYFDNQYNLTSFIKAMLFMPQGDVATRPFYGHAPIGVAWSLNYEMYFYAIFGLSMIFGRLRWLVLSLFSVVTLIGIPFFTRGEFSTNVFGIYNFPYTYIEMITNPIIWLFFSGVVIGLIYKSNFSIKSTFWCKILLSLSVTACIWQYTERYQVNHGVFLWGLTIIPFVLIISICNKSLDLYFPKQLSTIGDMSYSLYLIHIPVMDTLKLLFSKFNLPAYGIPFFIVYICFSLVIAAISYRYLEVRLSEKVKVFLIDRVNKKAEKGFA
ncbi:acyltransferase family protein [Yokenella regensburgei]|uniref:acyltransferase family protein n=2 Tax=Yokenella regensburgei TaxID=158877 RepID=UPI002572AC0D|nr:acyltransferase [Yokenella regensburgei]